MSNQFDVFTSGKQAVRVSGNAAIHYSIRHTIICIANRTAVIIADGSID